MLSAFKPKKTFVAFTDADGCIFNSMYSMLLMHLIIEHHDFFDQYAKTKEIYNENKILVDEVLAEITATIEPLIQYYEGGKTSLKNILYEVLTDNLLELLGPQDDFIIDENRYKFTAKIKTTYIKYFNNCGESGKNLLNTIVLAANHAYLQKIKTIIEREGYNDFVLMCGSNRQSKGVDEINNQYNGTTSFFPVLVALKDKFNELLNSGTSGVQCTLDMFLMADIYGKRRPGHNFKLILERLNDERVQDKHRLDSYIFDKGKFSLLYAAMHHLCRARPYEKIKFTFWDDCESIYLPLMRAFNDNDHFIPKKLTLECWPYKGRILVENQATMNPEEIKNGYIFIKKGTGIVDQFFEENVRKLGELASYKKKPNCDIDMLKDMDLIEFESWRHPFDVVPMEEVMSRRFGL